MHITTPPLHVGPHYLLQSKLGILVCNLPGFLQPQLYSQLRSGKVITHQAWTHLEKVQKMSGKTSIVGKSGTNAKGKLKSQRKGKVKLKGKHSPSEKNACPQGDQRMVIRGDIAQLSENEKAKANVKGERRQWTEKEKVKVVIYITEPERFPDFKVNQAHVY
jgi:hypothetical protein